MRYPATLVQGTFLRRYKRFLVDVVLPDGSEVTAHLANTGSMRACTEERAAVRLSLSDNPKRKLPWSVEQIRVDGRWICVNTGRPNAIVAEALSEGLVPELRGYARQRREVKLGNSRLDLCLDNPPDGPIAWVEVKNATLREGHRIFFPDAVTARGTKHVHELAQVVRPDVRAVLFFHVGTEGGDVISPADHIDPTYAKALRKAVDAGVEVLAWRSAMDADQVRLVEPVPVELGP